MTQESRFKPTEERIMGAIYGAGLGALATVADNTFTGYGAAALDYVRDIIEKTEGDIIRTPLVVGALAGGVLGYFTPNLTKAASKIVWKSAKAFGRGILKYTPWAARKAYSGVKAVKEQYNLRNAGADPTKKIGRAHV